MKNLPVNTLERQIAHRDHVASDYIHGRASAADRSEDGLKTYIDILRRRKWYIIISLLIVVPLTILILAIEKPVYQSKARILIENDTPQVLKIQELLAENDKSPSLYLTEYTLIKNRENIEETVDVLKLDKKVPEEEHPFMKAIDTTLGLPKKIVSLLKKHMMSMVAPTTGDAVKAVTDPAQIYRMEVITKLFASTTVVPIEGTRLADITITGSDPDEVAQQVNTLAEVYLRRNLEKKLEISRKAVAWLTQKTAELKEKTHAAELALQDFREKKNLVSLDIGGKQTNIIHERLAELQTAYTQANTARVDFQSRLNKLKGLSADNLENVEVFPTAVNNSLVRSLRQTYLDLLAQQNNSAEVFKARHPKMVQLQSQIDAAKRALNEELRKIVSAMQAEYSVLQTKEDTLARELNAQKEGTLRLSSDMITYSALQSEVENQRSLYLEAAKRLEEIKLTQAVITNNVKIVEPGAIPLAPVASKKAITLFLSIILGCMLGTGLAFIREYFDDRFRDADEVERNLHTPFLGLIPHYAVDRRRAAFPIALRQPQSPAAEAYRFLRTRLMSFAPDLKTLLVTSVASAEGKSTLTANLGISFAQLGLKVLLVDTDLRRPALHRYLQLPKDTGLTTVLEQKEDWQRVLQDTVMPNLKALPTGPTPHNPSDILSRRALQQLFAQLKEAFDLVLVDTSLALSVPDVEILAPVMDGVLLIHTPGQCDRKSVLEAKIRLERVGANILGIVFNNVKKDRQKYYYHNYYGKYHVDGVLYYDGHDQKPIESHSLSQELTTMPQRNTQANNPNIDIVIRDFKLEKRISEKQSNENCIFLILDLEILNRLNVPYTFTPQKIMLYIDRPDKYGVALSSIYEDKSQQEIKMDGVYKYSNITQTFKGGLVDERIIHPHESIRGLVVFHIPENVHNFILSHNDESINISISPIENS